MKNLLVLFALLAAPLAARAQSPNNPYAPSAQERQQQATNNQQMEQQQRASYEESSRQAAEYDRQRQADYDAGQRRSDARERESTASAYAPAPMRKPEFRPMTHEEEKAARKNARLKESGRSAYHDSAPRNSAPRRSAPRRSVPPAPSFPVIIPGI